MLLLIGVEAALVALIAASQRGIALCESLLRAQLGYRVNDMILAKALTLELAQFEDSEFYDKLTRARRDASTRPLNLVRQSFGLLQNLISLLSYAALLSQLSVLAVGVFLLAGLPAFLAEARFSGEAFALFRWRSPDTRVQIYLETVLAREDHAKEVKVYGLGGPILRRYGDIFRKLYRRDRSLALRREGWGFALGLLGTAALYGGYAWVALQAVAQRISLGEMTMYLLLLRQGQAAVTASLAALGGLYEDNLYLTNLYEFLEQPVPDSVGHVTAGAAPGDGIRFERVSFRYPGATGDAVSGIDLHLRPGRSLALVGDNGAGKTTLIKLLTRLYRPTRGKSCWTARRWTPGTRRPCASASRWCSRTSTATSSRSARTSAPATCATCTTRPAGGRRPPTAWRRPSSIPCPVGTARSLAAGSRAAGNCPAGSGKSSPCRGPSCAARRTSWCWTSRPPPWTPRPRRSVRALPAPGGPAHGDPDLAPLLHRAHGGRNPGDARRRDRRARHPRAAAPRRAATTRGCSRCRRPATDERRGRWPAPAFAIMPRAA